jgi:putative CocE/NonD family hydrolase
MSAKNDSGENEVNTAVSENGKLESSLAVPSNGFAPTRYAPPDWSDVSYYLSMRDGVRLAISIYFPDHMPPVKPAPLILVQTRYGRAGARLKDSDNPRGLDPWLRAGYVVSTVDVRGTTSSFGPRVCELGPDEQADMDEIIEHLASLPWSNGKIIATGTSYTANTADLATTRLLPALVGAIPRATDFDWWEGLWPGGIQSDAPIRDWAAMVYDMDFGRSTVVSDEKVLNGQSTVHDIAKLFPLIQPVDEDVDNKLVHEALRTREADGRHWTADDYNNIFFRDDKTANGHSFWDASAAAYMDDVRREKKPVQYWASWMDATTGDEAINRFRSAPEVPSVIIITANDHGGNILADPFFLDSIDPLPAMEEQDTMRLAFANDIMNGKLPSRIIKYYILGERSFRETAIWPPQGVEYAHFNLDQAGTLTRSVPVNGKDIYDVDFTATTGKYNRWNQGPRPVYDDRRDHDLKLLTYDTPPFIEDMELVGWPVVSLQMSTATSDPAVFAYLEDVAPDGRVTYITEGQLRAINRKIADLNALSYDPGEVPHSFKRADALPVVPGEKFSLSFKLYAVAALIKKGHRVRLAIGGADTGSFRRLSHAPERFEIYRGGSEMSRLNLPLRPL